MTTYFNEAISHDLVCDLQTNLDAIHSVVEDTIKALESVLQKSGPVLVIPLKDFYYPQTNPHDQVEAFRKEHLDEIRKYAKAGLRKRDVHPEVRLYWEGLLEELTS